MISAIMEALQMMTKGEKKRLKRKAKFAQGSKTVSQLGIPSWEEVWVHIQEHSEGLGNEFAERADDEDYKEEYEEATGKSADEDFDAYEHWFYENIMKPEQKSRYDDNIEFLNGLQKVTCYRAMALPKGVDPTKHMDIGIYWSLSTKGAREYWPPKTKSETSSVIYEAEVEKKAIDMWETMLARMNPAIGDEEDEITLIQGAPIFITEVTLVKNGQWTDVEVNDWRHA